jgi:hypothetical protein
LVSTAIRCLLLIDWLSVGGRHQEVGKKRNGLFAYGRRLERLDGLYTKIWAGSVLDSCIGRTLWHAQPAVKSILSLAVYVVSLDKIFQKSF